VSVRRRPCSLRDGSRPKERGSVESWRHVDRIVIARDERALDDEGRWRSNPGDGAPELEAAGVDPFSLEYEVRLAEHRSALAIGWMRAHPREVVRLTGLHVWQELRPRRGRTDWRPLVPAVLATLVVFRRHPGTPIVALVLAAMTASVALTWGSVGRFILPVHPTAVAIAAAMIVVLVTWAAHALRRAPRDTS
jgi:hypothetical protein